MKMKAQEILIVLFWCLRSLWRVEFCLKQSCELLKVKEVAEAELECISNATRGKEMRLARCAVVVAVYTNTNLCTFHNKLLNDAIVLNPQE